MSIAYDKWCSVVLDIICNDMVMKWYHIVGYDVM